MEFLNICDRLRILVLILPPHSTHKLQPCDVGCFLPLATCYSQEVTNIIHKSAGLVSMTKRMFWPCFKRAWDNAVTPENINSAFTQTGIWPFNPRIILDKYEPRPVTPLQNSERGKNCLKTPLSVRKIRQFNKAILKSPSKDMIRKLIKANEINASQAAIAKHQVEGLKEALVIEKKKRKRGKKLNLIGEDAGKAQWFGTEEILRANKLEDEKEARIIQEKQDKIAKKDQAAVDRAIKAAQKKQEKEERAIQRVVDTQAKKERRAQEVLNNRAAQQAAAQAKRDAGKSKPSQIIILKVPSNILTGLGSHEIIAQEVAGTEVAIPPQATRRGREIKLPQRLRNP